MCSSSEAAVRPSVSALMPAPHRECLFCSGLRATSTMGTVGVWVHEDGDARSVMIAPIRHIIVMEDLTPTEVLDIHAAIAGVRASWGQMGAPGQANIVWNLGPVAGQSVEHVHCHVVERTKSGLLPGFGARWWMKSDLRARPLLLLCARLNGHLRSGGHRESRPT